MEKLRELAEKVGEWLDSWLFFGIVVEEDGRTGKTHYIKCEKEFYQDVEEGYKPFEVRKNDRDYQAGDDIILKEYDKDLGILTGRELKVNIIYYLDNYPGIEPGYCILGIEPY